MYRIMIVDDEPTAVNLIKTIIEKKFEEYLVVGTAYDGKEALEKIKACRPDVIITDIQMPVMNGLALVQEIQKDYPDMISVVVSGYQEFEYAKEAMHYGVTDYILKPIVPSELQEVFQKIEPRLRLKYYRYRNVLMHRLVNDIEVDEKELQQYFKSDCYYGAIVRLNGLLTRFMERNTVEIFSDINEWMLTYGRDAQETLYLCPEEILCGRDYVETIKRHIEKEQPESSYLTAVIFEKPVKVNEIGEMVNALYRTLDSTITLGKNQILVLKDGDSKPEDTIDRNYDYLQELEYLAQKQQYERLQHKMEDLMAKWGKEEHPQIWLESRIRQICYLLQRYGAGNEDYRECEFLMDEAFSNAENMEQLMVDIEDIFFKDKKDDNQEVQKLGKEEYFRKIKEYITANIAQPLSLQKVSREMGISQTYLSKLFRKYENSSFNNYVTALRMEKAKKLLQSEAKLFVKDVAEQVGYKDQFYFSRIFFSYTGVRPSEYVEKEQKNVI